MLRLNVKMSEVLLLRLRIVRPFIHCLILFANVNFTHVGHGKNYATVEINPYMLLAWLNFPLTFRASDRLEKSNTSLLGFSLVERNILKNFYSNVVKQN